MNLVVDNIDFKKHLLDIRNNFKKLYSVDIIEERLNMQNLQYEKQLNQLILSLSSIESRKLLKELC